jgi:hypothetical protein
MADFPGGGARHYRPIIGSGSYSELSVNLLIPKGLIFGIFSEWRLKMQRKWSDFDSAIRRFESSRPSQVSLGKMDTYVLPDRSPTPFLCCVMLQKISGQFQRSPKNAGNATQYGCNIRRRSARCSPKSDYVCRGGNCGIRREHCSLREL